MWEQTSIGRQDVMSREYERVEVMSMRRGLIAEKFYVVHEDTNDPQWRALAEARRLDRDYRQKVALAQSAMARRDDAIRRAGGLVRPGVLAAGLELSRERVRQILNNTTKGAT